MKDLYSFLDLTSNQSDFKANLSNRGGFITFSNSGRRGGVKYFQIGLDNLLQTLKDILENLEVFADLTDYVEKSWRDNGSAYFTDPVANANSTVQTKPLFSTLSKIIIWANQPDLDSINPDSQIILTEDSLSKAIEKLEAIAETFRPKLLLGTESLNSKTSLSSRQIIYYGAPGTGKSHEIKKQTGELLDDGKEVDLPNVFRTTFHPDTDYASFVGCYKPAMRPTSKEEKTLTGKDEEIAYTFVPQVFTDAYVYAYNNSTEQTYLVIEEINRGNCAQIFGDLFQLLDRKDGKSEYKIKADKDLAKYLSEAKDKDGQDILKDKEGIKDGKLCLPANLHILATMNTSDQSLFPMDSAFKRRWEWEYVPINYGTDVQSGEFEITIGEKKYPWVTFIEKVNEKIIALTQSEDKQMGNFFIKHSIDEKGFKSKVMFYLWYEVLRDETENNKYFFYGKTTVDGKEVLSKFTFKDLYTDKATETLQQFMEYLGVASK